MVCIVRQPMDKPCACIARVEGARNPLVGLTIIEEREEGNP